MKTIRIGCGQGFWGDSLSAPLELLHNGPLDYLVLDYLAEVTMSILSKQMEKNPAAGYARDFVDNIKLLAPELKKRGTKVIANAGGVNPLACASAVLNALAEISADKSFKIAIVHGDNLFPSIDDLLTKGEKFSNLDSNEDFKIIKSKLRSANAYIGSSGIVSALAQGADIVITGRVADPCLVLAPAIHEFKWQEQQVNHLASAIVAGHIIECGAQCSGGNFSYDWSAVPDLENIGYPLVEISESGEFVVTKQENTGGLVSLESVKEQLIYEIGDPTSYITPDVIVDFTSIQLEEVGKNRIKVSGVKGKERPEKLKVSCSYFSGYTASGSLIYSWPDAYEKAKKTAQIIKARLSKKGISLEKYYVEFIGLNSCHGINSSPVTAEQNEILLKISVRDSIEKNVLAFTREVAPLVLNGPPAVSGYFSSKGKVQEVFSYWPTLVSRANVKEIVNLIN